MRNSKGSAIVLVLMAVMLLIVLGGGLTALGQQQRLRTVRTSQKIAARSAADAALMKAHYEVNQYLKENPDLEDDFPSATGVTLNDKQSYSFEIVEIAEDEYQIQATGNSGGILKKVYADIFISSSRKGNGITVEDEFNLKNNGYVGAYDSTVEGAPEEQGLSVTVGTLSDFDSKFEIENNTTIDGDVFVGFEAEPDDVIDSSGEITGETYALEEEIELDPVIVPGGLEDKGEDIEVNKNTTLKPDGSGKYGSMRIKNNKKLYIKDGEVVLHIDGNIELENKTEIIIEDGASLKIYLDGNLEAKNKAEINSSGKSPKDFKLYGTAESSNEIAFKNSTNMYGVVYAPGNEVYLKNNTKFCGSIVSDDFEMKNNDEFYQDVSLEDSVKNSRAEFKIGYWYE